MIEVAGGEGDSDRIFEAVVEDAGAAVADADAADAVAAAAVAAAAVVADAG